MKKIIIAIIAILIISGNKSCFCCLDLLGGGGAEITPGTGSELTSDGDGTAHPPLDEGPVDSGGGPGGDSGGISPEGITDPAEGTSPVSPSEPVVEKVSGEQTVAGGLELDLDSDITDSQPAGGMEDVSPQPAVVEEVTAGNNPGEQTPNGNAQSPSGTITDATLSAQDAGTEGPPTPADVSGGEPVSGSSGEDLPMMGGGRDGVDDGVYQSEDKNGAHADEGEQVTTGDEEGGKSPPADTPPPSSNSDETGPIGQLPGDKNRDDKQGYGANNTANDPSDVQNSGHQEDIVDKTVKELEKGPHTQLSVVLSESWLNSDREDFKRRAPGMIKDKRTSPSAKIGLYTTGVSNGVDVPPPSPPGGDGDGGDGDGNNDDGLSFLLYLGKDKRISQQEQNRWELMRDLRVKAEGAQQFDSYKQVLGQHLGYAWTHTQLTERELKEIAQYYSAQDAEFKGWFAQNIWWASVMAAQQGNSTGMDNFQQFLGQLSPSQQEEVYSIIKTVGPIDGEGRMGSSIDTSPEGEFHPSVSPGPSGGNFYSVGSVNNGVQREVGYSGMGLTYAGEGFNLSDSSDPLGMNFYSPGSVDDYGMQREEGSGRYYASVLSPLYGGYLSGNDLGALISAYPSLYRASVSSATVGWVGSYLMENGYLGPEEFARMMAEAGQKGLTADEVKLALLEIGKAGGLSFSDIYAALYFKGDHLADVKLSGLGLSDYYLGLLVGNNIFNALQIRFKDLSRLGKLTDYTGWEQFWDLYSPQAIIREILKKLNPRKLTRQAAKFKLLFPEEISPIQLMVILLSIIVFALALGYSAARYHLSRRKEFLTIPISR